MLPVLASAFAAGIYTAVTGWPIWLTAAVLLSVLAAFFAMGGKLRRPAIMAAVFFLVGSGVCCLSDYQINNQTQGIFGREVTVTGFIHQVDEAGPEACAFVFQAETLRSDGAQEKPFRQKIRVTVRNPALGFVPEYGRRLQLSGVFLEPEARRNPGGFDYAAYLLSEGIAAVMNLQGGNIAELEGAGGHRFLAIIEAVRSRVFEILSINLPGEEAALAAGLLLGYRGWLSPEAVDAYRILGMAHILAVSGLHAGFVAAFAFFLARLLLRAGLKIPPPVFAMALLLFYALLTGGKPPVWRAVIMFGCSLAGRELGRETGAANGLALAALLLLFVRPYWLFSLSFQMSFLAVLGITGLSSRLAEHLAFLPKGLARGLAVTLSAQVAVMPLQVTAFGLIPVLALPANLLAVPLVGFAMTLLMAGTLLGFIFPPIAAPLYTAALPLLALLVRIPPKISSLPFAAVTVTPYPALFGLFCLLVVVLAVLLPRTFWSKGRVLAACLLVLNLLVWAGMGNAMDRGHMEITFIDVGQGLSVFVRTTDGVTLLMDAGGRKGGDFDTGERILLPFLYDRRVKKLDLVILSHPHEDHYGGLPFLLDRFPVALFACNGAEDTSATYLKLKEMLAAREIPVIKLKEGDTIYLGDETVIRVLSPPDPPFAGIEDETNNNSLVLHLAFRDFALLLTGDAEERATGRLAAEYGGTLNSNLLQVPHHGSRNAMAAPFLAAVQAEAAVISAGRNVFGHPHPETLEQLSGHNVQVYRTDINGAVTFLTDGKNWETRTMLSSAVSR